MKKNLKLSQEDFDKKYPTVTYTVSCNWNRPKAVPGKPDRNPDREFGNTDCRIAVAGWGMLDWQFERLYTIGISVGNDQGKVYIKDNGVGNNVKTWSDARIIEKSRKQDWIKK